MCDLWVQEEVGSLLNDEIRMFKKWWNLRAVVWLNIFNWLEIACELSDGQGKRK